MLSLAEAPPPQPSPASGRGGASDPMRQLRLLPLSKIHRFRMGWKLPLPLAGEGWGGGLSTGKIKIGWLPHPRELGETRGALARGSNERS